MNSAEDLTYKTLLYRFAEGKWSNKAAIEAAEREVLLLTNDAYRTALLRILANLWAKHGEWARAEAAAQAIPDSLLYEKTLACTETAEKMMLAPDRRRAEKVLTQAEQMAEAFTTDEVWTKAALLAGLAKLFFALADPERATKLWTAAIRIAQEGQESAENRAYPNALLDSCKVLETIAIDMARAGRWARAYEVAQSIQLSGRRDRALNLLEKLATEGSAN